MSLSVFLFLVIGIFYSATQIDQRLVEKTQQFQKKASPNLRKLLLFFSNTPFLIGAFLLTPFFFLIFTDDLYSAITLLLSCVLSLGISFVGKFIFLRTRPQDYFSPYGPTDSSFPSAHTAGVFAAALTLGTFFPFLKIPLILLASLTAYSRIFKEVHYLSDVLGGILVAIFATYIATNSGLLLFLGF